MPTPSLLVSGNTRGLYKQYNNVQPPVKLYVRPNDAKDAKDILTQGNYIVTGINIEERDTCSIVNTIGQSVYMYLTSKAPVSIVLTGEVYFNCAEPSANPLKAAIQTTWMRYRVSEYKKPIKILLDNVSYWLYLEAVRFVGSASGSDSLAFQLSGTGIQG